jgi:hypothetical protein
MRSGRTNGVNILLKGVLGTPGVKPESDQIGIYAAPTEDFHGLTLPLSVVFADGVLLEAREFCSRALACEPTLLRLLWLPESSLEVRTPFGDQLRELRGSFPSQEPLRESYGRALLAELRELQQPRLPEPEVESSALRLRQLGREALELFRTGQILFAPEDEEDVEAFCWHAKKGHHDRMRDYVLWIQSELNAETSWRERESKLPAEPDTGMIEDWLKYVRTRYFMTD